ncbi:RNA-directed DNA polymerase from mobile element jockey-like [Brachionus plicatilis]|uniref:RNA-directed DNA polymerase from mobile element jockey-like n=1 Tax=Brachionus plicatilis TaxID=10195 RepID=A0A3M7R9C5_BRAPC|nr:RNA-directed DNA polymerase from mobile element jockey-like [Brachionus plicatilis]
MNRLLKFGTLRNSSVQKHFEKHLKKQIELSLSLLFYWSYADRLAVLGLTTLQERRVRGDMIQLFKFYRGFNAVCWVKPMEHCNSLSQAGPAGNFRGHRRRLSGQVTTKCQQRANFFTNRVINEWNALTVTVLTVPILAGGLWPVYFGELIFGPFN